MSLFTCPDESILKQLIQGRIFMDSDTEDHLAHCKHCLDRLEGLSTGCRSTLSPRTLLQHTPTDSKMEETQAYQQRSNILPQIHVPVNGQSFPFLDYPEYPGDMGCLGQYRVLELLGEGGMGWVFRAEDTRLKRTVALKIMKPEIATAPFAKERFLREAQATALLDHENIVTIYQVDEVNATPFIAMQWLRGESLENRIRRENRIPLDHLLSLGQQIAQGLAHAHSNQLIHRDIKLANIWVEESGKIKILDFGLARPLDDKVHLTQTGTFVGTPAYVAPEQARGLTVDHRSDLFSLGVVLYRMCTGELPFQGKSTMALLTSLAVDQPTPPIQLGLEIPVKLSELIMKLLEKEPENRPQSAREVADILQAIQAKTHQIRTVQPKKSSATPTKKNRKIKDHSTQLVSGLNAKKSPTQDHEADRKSLLTTKAKKNRANKKMQKLLSIAFGSTIVVLLLAILIREKDSTQKVEIDSTKVLKLEMVEGGKRPPMDKKGFFPKMDFKGEPKFFFPP